MVIKRVFIDNKEVSEDLSEGKSKKKSSLNRTTITLPVISERFRFRSVIHFGTKALISHYSNRSRIQAVRVRSKLGGLRELRDGEGETSELVHFLSG